MNKKKQIKHVYLVSPFDYEWPAFSITEENAVLETLKRHLSALRRPSINVPLPKNTPKEERRQRRCQLKEEILSKEEPNHEELESKRKALRKQFMVMTSQGSQALVSIVHSSVYFKHRMIYNASFNLSIYLAWRDKEAILTTRTDFHPIEGYWQVELPARHSTGEFSERMKLSGVISQEKFKQEELFMTAFSVGGGGISKKR
ncbi:uncharacterized protein LOC136043445 isoform X2 [Artemia franciscana]|uniref:uncharacterized protein LOC136043445 isoform X2 n=1 Tax=Artemia franciscana TaxID=6661 RepID=UPI0032DB1652